MTLTQSSLLFLAIDKMLINFFEKKNLFGQFERDKRKNHRKHEKSIFFVKNDNLVIFCHLFYCNKEQMRAPAVTLMWAMWVRIPLFKSILLSTNLVCKILLARMKLVYTWWCCVLYCMSYKHWFLFLASENYVPALGHLMARHQTTRAWRGLTRVGFMFCWNCRCNVLPKQRGPEFSSRANDTFPLVSMMIVFWCVG